MRRCQRKTHVPPAGSELFTRPGTGVSGFSQGRNSNPGQKNYLSRGGSILLSGIACSLLSEIAAARRDFFFYVDEFQNLASENFVTLFAEARKFRLGLIVANQYADQLDAVRGPP